MKWQVGDKVAIAVDDLSGDWYYKVERVGRLTPTQVVLRNGNKYNRKTGRRIPREDGGRIQRYTLSIQNHNNEYRDNQRKRELASQIRKTNMYALSIETLEAILELCQETSDDQSRAN